MLYLALMSILSKLKNTLSKALHHSSCSLLKILESGSDEELRQTIQVSSAVFSAILNVLAPFLQDGQSRNRGQNFSAELKLAVALFYFAHGGSSMHLLTASGLSLSVARQFVYLAAN